MAIAAFAVAQAAVSQVQAKTTATQTPPSRIVVVIADLKPAPEQR